MDEAIHAIAEPRRRAILQLVWGRELPAGEIAAHFAVTRPAISQHLRVLKDAGLVTERRQGTKRLYRALPEGMAGLRAFLEEFWEEQLVAPGENGEGVQADESGQSRFSRMKLRPG